MRTSLLAMLCLLGAYSTAVAQFQPAGDLSQRDRISRSYLAQNIGAGVPHDAAFVDDQGRDVTLGDYFGHTPVLLVLGYFTCPDLCPMTFRHLTEELNGIAFIAGRDFQVIIVSFDPRDTPEIASLQKQSCLRAYKWPAQTDGWHFLTGTRQASDTLAAAVGFQYTFDRSQNKFVHPTGVMVFSPKGKLTHYFYGIDASPADIESAIRDAAVGRASTVDQPEQQYCVDYDPRSSPRGRFVTRILNGGCIAWAGTLFGYIALKLARDARHPRSGAGP
jgi:protein SCO1